MRNAHNNNIPYDQQEENQNGLFFSGLLPPPPPPAVTPDTPAAVVMNSLSASFSRRLNVVDNPPPENPRLEDIEKFAASEMNQLSMNEREQVLYDLHGISEKIPVETPEFLLAKLQEMEEAIQNISDDDKEVYNTALLIDPLYVKNAQFRLKFLRADLFDAAAAAMRYTKHYQAKLELFGRHLLCKDITQDDLQEDEEGTLDCIYSGWLQDLPIRDISGRVVSFMFQKAREPKWTAEAKCRAIWYRRMLNSQDIETQQKGHVLVLFNSEQEADRTSVWKAARIAACLPLRFVAFHMCYLPEYYESQGAALSLGRIAMESYHRHRHRTHTGTMEELKYTLQTFGIPMSALPMDDAGDVPVSYNREVLKKQRMVERHRVSPPTTSTTEEVYGTDTTDGTFHSQQQQQQQYVRFIATPGKNDVLMGRGRSCQEHPGYVAFMDPKKSRCYFDSWLFSSQSFVFLVVSSFFYWTCRNVRFRYLIEQNLERYDATAKHLKMPIALEILKEIHQLGGRFLTPCDAGWKEIDEISAREKVSSCFRSFRKVKGHGKKGAATTSQATQSNSMMMMKRQAEEFSQFSLSDKERRMF